MPKAVKEGWITQHPLSQKPVIVVNEDWAHQVEKELRAVVELLDAHNIPPARTTAARVNRLLRRLVQLERRRGKQ